MDGMEAVASFEEMFFAYSERKPYRWQIEMFVRFLKGDVPGVIDLPTGTGKTSLMAIWYFALAWANAKSLLLPLNRIALGHNEEEKNPDRLIYLPISTVGFGYTDGRIRRVIVAIRSRPDLLQLLRRKMNGRVLTNQAGKEMCRLGVAARNKVTGLYLEPRSEWATVTPVVLHGFNASDGQININKTEKLVGQAFEQAGISTSLIDEWAFQPAPFWGGTSGARSMRVPKHLERWPRYHVWVKFRQKVGGPVLAGIGRHYGLGVFASVDRSE